MKKRSLRQKMHCLKQVYEEQNLKVNRLGGLMLLFFVFFFSTISAQEAVISSGGDGSGSGGSVSYSVGAVVYTTNTGTSGSVAQGVQHPYEIYVVTGIEEVQGIDLEISAYPNPVTDYLILKVDDENLIGATYLLYNLEGRLLENNELVNNETHIYMNKLKPATYFLKVFNNNKEIKTFKIVKN